MSRQYRMVFAPTAKRSLRKLDRQVLSRIKVATEGLQHTPRPDGCKKLTGSIDLYRVRVGDYRIIYSIDDDELLVIVAEVMHRSKGY